MSSTTKVLFQMKYFKLVIYLPIGLLILASVHPGRFASHYDYIKQEDIWSDLVKKISKNITVLSKSKSCDYTSVLKDDSGINLELLTGMTLDTGSLKNGGEYVPLGCKPLFSTAVIVPYRDRHKQLKDFLTYMHVFLRRQHLHYRIYVVEQDDAKPFNRAKLLNIGAVMAIKHGFPCLVLHDVDLLPLRYNNIYACTKLPRHMSSSIDKFRFNLPYEKLFGGAVSILSEQFVAANGMSNNYFGWGAEDDDLYQRLEAIQLVPVRLEPRVSLYTMMRHKPEDASLMKNNLLATAPMRYATDGLNSLSYVEKGYKLHTLFTHIAVEL